MPMCFLHSLKIHMLCCRKKFVNAENLKPEEDRKQLPKPPPELSDPLPEDAKGIEAFNQRMTDIWNQATLVPCPKCGRTFMYAKCTTMIFAPCPLELFMLHVIEHTCAKLYSNVATVSTDMNP